MSVADELAALGRLHEEGALSDDEFSKAKALLLRDGPVSGAELTPAPSGEAVSAVADVERDARLDAQMAAGRARVQQGEEVFGVNLSHRGISILVAVGLVLALGGLFAMCSESDTPSVGDSNGAGTMPDLIGEDLQTAQDTVQTYGIIYSSSHDVTGQDRSQILDSGWVVVTQDPAAGTPITEDTDVDFGVKRDGE